MLNCGLKLQIDPRRLTTCVEGHIGMVFFEVAVIAPPLGIFFSAVGMVAVIFFTKFYGIDFAPGESRTSSVFQSHHSKNTSFTRRIDAAGP